VSLQSDIFIFNYKEIASGTCDLLIVSSY